MPHAIIRTSPKGQEFIGVCTKCGTENLRANQANERCENVRGVTQGQALMEILDKEKLS